MTHDLLSMSCSNLEIHHLPFQAMGEPAKPIAAPSKLLEPRISIFRRNSKYVQLKATIASISGQCKGIKLIWKLLFHVWQVETWNSHVQSDTFSTLLIRIWQRLTMQKNCKQNYAAPMGSRSLLNVMCMPFPKAYDVPTLKQMGSVPKTAQGSIEKRGLFLFPPATLLKNLQPKVTQRVGNLRFAWPLKGADSIIFIARRFRRCSQVSSPISWVVRLQASPAWLQC